MGEVAVTNNRDASRYEARIGEEIVARSEYSLAGRRIVFSHTEVSEDHEGEGIGSTLVRWALDDVRDNLRLEVVPICPFVAAWIKRHPEYAELVTPPLRSQFQTPSAATKDHR